MANYPLDYTGPQIDALLEKIDELGEATTEEAGLMSTADKGKLNGIATGAQANVIEQVEVGGNTLEPVNKKVTIPVDSAPASGSNNPVSSGALYAALLNYYTSAEVDQLIAGIKQFTYKVVDVLPTASADTMYCIYFVPSTNPETQNVKDEFITVENDGTYSWEQIGTTAVDLSGYSTTEQMNAAISQAVQNLFWSRGDESFLRAGGFYDSSTDTYYALPGSDHEGVSDVKVLALKDTDAAEGNLAVFDENGDLVDSGIAADEVAVADGEYEDMTVGLAENLSSWAEDFSEVTNQWDETIRTTAGTDAIRTEKGGTLVSIVATEGDFKCDTFRTTAYNQLRLVSNGGGAKKLSGSETYVIPIPKLELGAFGDATFNNGMLFTAKPAGYVSGAAFGGANLQPTVRFVPLASGEPTSASAGTVVTPTTVTYEDKTYKTYLTPGEGWLIVSGITWADTCAHLAWEDWYDRFVSPTDEGDTGDNISLAALFTAATNGTGKFLTLGSVATRADRISATQMRITDPIARVASPAWTTEEVESATEGSEASYKHSLVISAMKSNGLAEIEGSDQTLIVEGTTVYYTDNSSTAISGAVRYERASAATATVTLAKTSYDLDDCGVEMKEGAVGKAFFECSYAQNVADALSQIAKVKLDSSMRVIAEALSELNTAIENVKALLAGKDVAVLPSVKVQSVEADDYRTLGCPRVLIATTAGAPSASVIPSNWDEERAGVWYGAPRFIGQQYIDRPSKKVYMAVALTDSTADWVALN